MRTKDPEKQRRIKDAMISLILKEGISGASVAKIARDAGVSPATIYVYYDSKEEMLAEVFSEYAFSTYHYLTERIYREMSGAQLIDTLIRSTYAYASEHEEIFSFVEQCSCCPTLQESVCHTECSFDLLDLIHDYQKRGIFRTCSDENLTAVLFAPVRYIAKNRRSSPDPEGQLNELIRMMQIMLLNR
ncbi:MAG: TetR/AcrR family transcriptional regulator [Solobacterium sp.]|nr:TetR/AcrR family transcriptional regulator [Solobacterium sp.]